MQAAGRNGVARPSCHRERQRAAALPDAGALIKRHAHARRPGMRWPSTARAAHLAKPEPKVLDENTQVRLDEPMETGGVGKSNRTHLAAEY